MGNRKMPPRPWPSGFPAAAARWPSWAPSILFKSFIYNQIKYDSGIWWSTEWRVMKVFSCGIANFSLCKSIMLRYIYRLIMIS